MIPFLVCRKTRLPKVIEVFSKLITCPDAASYSLTICSKLVLFLWSAFRKNKESSAKKRCDTDGPLLLTRIPYIFLSLFACVSRELKTSEQGMNEYGESGSPWYSPLLASKYPCGLPLIKTKKETERMHSIIKVIQRSAKPFF